MGSKIRVPVNRPIGGLNRALSAANRKASLVHANDLAWYRRVTAGIGPNTRAPDHQLSALP